MNFEDVDSGQYPVSECLFQFHSYNTGPKSHVFNVREAVLRRCFSKELFWEILQDLKKNIYIYKAESLFNEEWRQLLNQL